MKRVIVAPAPLTGEPLTELKQWLSITTDRENAFLETLLRASLEMCESFTGLMPLTQICEEVVPASRAIVRLATRPVRHLISVHALAPTGARTSIDSEARDVTLDADGIVTLQLLGPVQESRCVVRFAAGVADDWAALDAGLQHGLVRYAGFAYRERDREASAAIPPAAVVALWQPFRRLRLL